MLNHYPTSNNHYIIVPFCNGGDLRKYLNKKVKVSEEEGLKIIRNIIRGMNELYNNDIAHRDLKPDNILINDDIFKVADFGFSTLMNGESMKEKCGTPLYMSP
jgi:serine/threonine-protein kinase ULK/ATG1